jgi:ppGpp synthetase/RelA/SpoT-type nucleotidyltranferase
MATTKQEKLEFNAEDLATEFDKCQPRFRELQETGLFILEKILNESPIKIHSIPTRIKTVSSFVDKAKRQSCERPFEQIEDVVGLRVICLFLSDIEKIRVLIQDHFEVIRDDDKVDAPEYTSFGYMSRHIIAKLGENYSKTIYSGIKDLPFEIQIRTIAMDAWANISHYLDYKTDRDIPKELKRDFNALSGMFYVADKHFQLFFEQREEKQEEISTVLETGKKDDISSQPINLDTLMAYVRDRFPDRKKSSPDGVSKLVGELTGAGYTTLGQLGTTLDRSIDAFNHYEKETNRVGWFQDVGAVRVTLSIADDAYFDQVFKGSTVHKEEHRKKYQPYKKYLKP